MTTTKKLGIWMDHAGAHLMEFTQAEPIHTEKIESKFTHQVKTESLGKSESLMHNKEQQEQGEYYKELGEVIKNYDAVVLFGPTDAKLELKNLLQADHQFDDIEIDVQKAGKMTENQQHAFVRSHFSQKLVF